MQQLMGEINSQRGNRFTDEVADRLSENRSLVVRRRFRGFSRTPFLDEAGDLGDIDVLSANARRRVIHAIECKDLAPARTPAEMHNEMERLAGDTPGRSAVVRLQERRAEWLRAHLKDCLHWLGIESKGKWKIQPLLVAKQELIVPYLKRFRIPTLTFRELDKLN